MYISYYAIFFIHSIHVVLDEVVHMIHEKELLEIFSIYLATKVVTKSATT